MFVDDTSEGEHSFETPRVECTITQKEDSTVNDIHKKLLLESSDSKIYCKFHIVCTAESFVIHFVFSLF